MNSILQVQVYSVSLTISRKVESQLLPGNLNNKRRSHFRNYDKAANDIILSSKESSSSKVLQARPNFDVLNTFQ